MVWLLAHVPNGTKHLTGKVKALKDLDENIKVFKTD